jgi:DNA-binding XRE family transcriptional regulator
MTGRFRRADAIPAGQAAVVGANIRVLRQQHGWNQAKLGELMGWLSNSTVCAAEGRRRPPQWQAAGIHQTGGRAACHYLRRLPIAAHDAVRELRRAAAGRVRLPHMRSPTPDMKSDPLGTS